MLWQYILQEGYSPRRNSKKFREANVPERIMELKQREFDNLE
jgi:hypothetical protein